MSRKTDSAREPAEPSAPHEHRRFTAAGTAPHPWDGYLTGPENELALGAAQALARGEREGFSPLVVYGPSGVGKSRLLAGLVTEHLRLHPGSVVVHLDAQSFSLACSEAVGEVAGASWSALRGRFRSVDLFVLEDLEGLEGSSLARDELVHTLDALDARGAAVAVSAQSAPATWSRLKWPVRLISRFGGGLAVWIGPPTPASLRRYVLHIASQHGVALQAEAVETLIQAADGYRTLDGWIARLALEPRLEYNQTRRRGSHVKIVPRGGDYHPSRPMTETFDPQTVAAILAEETHLTKSLITVDTIARGVGKRFKVRLVVLRGPSRRASVVTARHLAMYLARILTDASFAVIGNYFGGRDPASVRHACKSAALRLSTDPILAAAVSTLAPPWSRASS